MFSRIFCFLYFSPEKYNVTTKTGTEPFSGTLDIIQMKLLGTVCKTYWIELNGAGTDVFHAEQEDILSGYLTPMGDVSNNNNNDDDDDNNNNNDNEKLLWVYFYFIYIYV